MAKSLRREKRREDATAVAALRRPGWDDWALNVVAAEQSPTIAAFTGAAGDVREAQAAAIEGRDGSDIREALRTLRDRSAELVGLATDVLGRVGREPAPGELNARLSEVAASETAAAQLRAAVLGSGDAAPEDLFADLQPASRPATRPKAAKRVAEPAAVTDPREDARRQRRLDAIAAATEKHDAATAALQRAEADVAAAEEEVAGAEAAVRRAAKELAVARRTRDKAADAAARTESALERAAR